MVTSINGFGDLRVSLLQNAMLIAGLITFLQLYPVGPIGGRLPASKGYTDPISIKFRQIREAALAVRFLWQMRRFLIFV